MAVPFFSKRDAVLALIADKERIEAKISDMGHILKENNIGLEEVLVDESGFPRNDIDVYQVRHARHQIICLQNDLKTLMHEIARGLEEVHAEARGNGNGVVAAPVADVDMNGTHGDNEPMETMSPQHSVPFIRVNVVSVGSPAEKAGMAVNDEIIEFGSVNRTNYTNLGQIGHLVQSRQNQAVSIRVKRGVQTYQLQLIPATWSGRGLLGCNIVDIE